MSRRIDSPVPAGTVLFMIRTWSPSSEQLLDDRPHPREVGVAGVGRRRVDADEEQAGARQQLVHVGGEGDPLGVAAQQVLEFGLVDRHLAAGEGVDLLLDDVAGDHLVAELGEAGRGDQPDPANSDDADRLQLLTHDFLLPCFFGFFLAMITSAERAMPIICSLVSVRRRSFEIQ